VVPLDVVVAVHKVALLCITKSMTIKLITMEVALKSAKNLENRFRHFKDVGSQTKWLRVLLPV